MYKYHSIQIILKKRGNVSGYNSEKLAINKINIFGYYSYSFNNPNTMLNKFDILGKTENLKINPIDKGVKKYPFVFGIILITIW